MYVRNLHSTCETKQIIGGKSAQNGKPGVKTDDYPADQAKIIGLRKIDPTETIGLFLLRFFRFSVLHNKTLTQKKKYLNPKRDATIP